LKALKHVTEFRILFIRQIVKRIRMSNFLINQQLGTWCMFNGQQRGSSMALGRVSPGEQDSQNSKEDVEQDVEAEMSCESFLVARRVTRLENLNTRVSKFK
jgi:hypothetical protein